MIRGFIAASLDGYIADPQGSVTFLAPYEDEPAGYDSFIATVGTLELSHKNLNAPLAKGYTQAVTSGVKTDWLRSLT